MLYTLFVNLHACLLSVSQGYQFEEDNPYLSHEDPLTEGVKRMEAGDIPGAVRLFESAVQREPDNQLVSLIAFSALKHNISEMDLPSFLEMFVFLLSFRPGSIWEHAKLRTSKSLQPSAPSAGQRRIHTCARTLLHTAVCRLCVFIDLFILIYLSSVILHSGALS